MFSLLKVAILVSAGVSALATGLSDRGSEGSESFSLYAYGDSLGGLPLFYAGGKAFVGDSTNPSLSNASVVSFTSDSDSTTWVANPNGTTKAKAGWSDEKLYIPSSSSSDHQMGFTSETLSNETTTGFFFYGQWVMVKTDNGNIYSSFYVRETSEGEGVYSLLWNVPDDDSAISISLRSSKPSN